MAYRFMPIQTNSIRLFFNNNLDYYSNRCKIVCKSYFWITNILFMKRNKTSYFTRYLTRNWKMSSISIFLRNCKNSAKPQYDHNARPAPLYFRHSLPHKKPFPCPRSPLLNKRQHMQEINPFNATYLFLYLLKT